MDSQTHTSSSLVYGALPGERLSGERSPLSPVSVFADLTPKVDRWRSLPGQCSFSPSRLGSIVTGTHTVPSLTNSSFEFLRRSDPPPAPLTVGTLTKRCPDPNTVSFLARKDCFPQGFSKGSDFLWRKKEGVRGTQRLWPNGGGGRGPYDLTS